MKRIEYIVSIFDLVSVFVLIVTSNVNARGDSGFDKNYIVTWGQVSKLNQGKEVQLSMDKYAGSAFESKHHYGSGFFQMRIKLPPRDTAGVVTAFYLTSKGNTHDEVDFEFLGNREGKPIAMQTNVFVNGRGNREQKFAFWFDPTTSFHTYGILWNPFHIVLYVDKIPIRIFKKTKRSGGDYPSNPMQVVASLWNGEAWATGGGKEKIDWTKAPFKANFQGFSDTGCNVDSSNNSSSKVCSSKTYWWNTRKYSKLSANEQKEFKHVRAKYMDYDYCTDRRRYPVPPIECQWNK
ncbi:unnamed protein product [Cochlearia groenlandica]